MLPRRRITIGILALCAGLAAVWAAPQGKSGPEGQLQAAINKETVEGDLKGAIEQYKKLSQSSNRAIAAEALIHMGECYEKLGSKEARAQYELVISKFSDQKDAVVQARAHLGGTAAKTGGRVNRPVWEEPPANSAAAAVSPDGRYISFVSGDSAGNIAWSLHDLSTGTDRRLMAVDLKDGIPGYAAFSADGKQIAYSFIGISGAGDLRILSLSGTAPAASRILPKSADIERYYQPAWSPDGKSIAVNVNRKSEKTDSLVLVSVQNGSSRVLASTGEDFDGGNLSFSPDGKYVAFDRSGDVFVVTVDGGNEVQAVNWPSEDHAFGWTPDGKRLLISSDRDGPIGLWALSFRDGKPQGLGAALIKADVGRPFGLTSSGDLYYRVTSGGQTLSFEQIAPFDWNTGRVLSPPVTLETADTSSAPEWSRDGKYLAYIKPSAAAGGVRRPPVVTIRTTETGLSRELGSDCLLRPIAHYWAPDSRTLAATGTGGLCLIDAQAGQISKVDITLGPGGSLQGQPEWSPDQEKLYFRLFSNRAGGGNGSMAFIEKDLASGNQREIIRRPTARELDAWHLSPDGRTIGVVSHDVSTKTAAVLLIPVAGGEPKELFRRPEADLWNLAFSPDGKYIVTVGYARTTWTPVLFIPTTGGEPREWLTATPPLMVTWGMWAPDSRSVFLRKTTMAREQTELWRVSVEGGQAAKLDTNASLDHIGVGPFLSPDGGQIVLTRQENTPRKNEIWVLGNFLSSIPPSK